MLDGLLDLDAGCVDEHVEPAVLALDAGHELDGALLARDVVAMEDDGAGARRGRGIGRGGDPGTGIGTRTGTRRGLGKAGRIHGRALGREPRANGRADS